MQDVVLIHTCFTLQYPLQLGKWELPHCPVAANTFREFTLAFFTDGDSQLVLQVCIVYSSYYTSHG